MKRTLRAAVCAALICAAGAAGGPAEAQSVFGLEFLGEHRYFANARQHALGLSAFAVPDSTSAISANAASLADLSRLTFSIFEQLGSSSIRNADTSAVENRFQLPSVMLAVPLRRGLVCGVGYRTRFEGKGDFSFSRSVEGVPATLEIYEHRSSLFTVPFTLAWKATDWASVAGELQLERGSIKDDAIVSINSTDYQPAVSERLRSFSGTSAAVSFLLKPHERITVGAHWNSAIDYNVSETFSYTRAELDSASEYDFSLPAAFGAGAAFGATERWWVSAYFWQRSAPEPDGFPQLAGSIGDERLISFGVERRRQSAGSFFSRIPIRLGFYEDRWHLERPEGRPVKSRFFTLGSGFALPGGPGMVDITFELGQIGSVSGNGLDERVFRIGLGISASEAWSKRKEER